MSIPLCTVATTPELIGVVAWWGLLLAAPIVFVRRRHRGRRAGLTAGERCEPGNAIRSGVECSRPHHRDEERPRQPPHDRRSDPSTRRADRGREVAAADARAAVPLRGLPTPSHARRARARTTAVGTSRRSMADRAISTQRRARQHAARARAIGRVRDRGHLRPGRLGRRRDDQPTSREDPGAASRLPRAGPRGDLPSVHCGATTALEPS